MGQQRRQQCAKQSEEKPQEQRDQGELKSSGVLPVSMVSWIRGLRHLDPWLPGEDPPWSVVDHYLANGNDEAGVEEHAKQSRAFAYVLESMRNQEEDLVDEETDPVDGPATEPPAASPDD